MDRSVGTPLALLSEHAEITGLAAESPHTCPSRAYALRSAVPIWRAGDVIALGAGRSLRVIDTRLSEGTDGDPVMVLVVEPV
jgi:hypothetical protein